MKSFKKMHATMAIPPPEHLWFLDSRRLPLDLVARITGRKPRTLARWRAHGIPDTACLAVLQAAAYGLLPGTDWQEWHVDRDGRLARWMAGSRHPTFTPGTLDDVARVHAQLADARRRIAALEADLEARSAPGYLAGDPPQLGLFLRS